MMMIWIMRFLLLQTTPFVSGHHEPWGPFEYKNVDYRNSHYKSQMSLSLSYLYFYHVNLHIWKNGLYIEMGPSSQQLKSWILQGEISASRALRSQSLCSSSIMRYFFSFRLPSIYLWSPKNLKWRLFFSTMEPTLTYWIAMATAASIWLFCTVLENVCVLSCEVQRNPIYKSRTLKVMIGLYLIFIDT